MEAFELSKVSQDKDTLARRDHEEYSADHLSENVEDLYGDTDEDIAKDDKDKEVEDLPTKMMNGRPITLNTHAVKKADAKEIGDMANIFRNNKTYLLPEDISTVLCYKTQLLLNANVKMFIPTTDNKMKCPFFRIEHGRLVRTKEYKPSMINKQSLRIITERLVGSSEGAGIPLWCEGTQMSEDYYMYILGCFKWSTLKSITEPGVVERHMLMSSMSDRVYLSVGKKIGAECQEINKSSLALSSTIINQGTSLEALFAKSTELERLTVMAMKTPTIMEIPEVMNMLVGMRDRVKMMSDVGEIKTSRKHFEDFLRVNANQLESEIPEYNRFKNIYRPLQTQVPSKASIVNVTEAINSILSSANQKEFTRADIYDGITSKIQTSLLDDPSTILRSDNVVANAVLKWAKGILRNQRILHIDEVNRFLEKGWKFDPYLIQLTPVNPKNPDSLPIVPKQPYLLDYIAMPDVEVEIWNAQNANKPTKPATFDIKKLFKKHSVLPELTAEQLEKAPPAIIDHYNRFKSDRSLTVTPPLPSNIMGKVKDLVKECLEKSIEIDLRPAIMKIVSKNYILIPSYERIETAMRSLALLSILKELGKMIASNPIYKGYPIDSVSPFATTHLNNLLLEPVYKKPILKCMLKQGFINFISYKILVYPHLLNDIADSIHTVNDSLVSAIIELRRPHDGDVKLFSSYLDSALRLYEKASRANIPSDGGKLVDRRDEISKMSTGTFVNIYTDYGINADTAQGRVITAITNLIFKKTITTKDIDPIIQNCIELGENGFFIFPLTILLERDEEFDLTIYLEKYLLKRPIFSLVIDGLRELMISLCMLSMVEKASDIIKPKQIKERYVEEMLVLAKTYQESLQLCQAENVDSGFSKRACDVLGNISDIDSNLLPYRKRLSASVDAFTGLWGMSLFFFLIHQENRAHDRLCKISHDTNVLKTSTELYDHSVVSWWFELKLSGCIFGVLESKHNEFVKFSKSTKILNPSFYRYLYPYTFIKDCTPMIACACVNNEYTKIIREATVQEQTATDELCPQKPITFDVMRRNDAYTLTSSLFLTTDKFQKLLTFPTDLFLIRSSELGDLFSALTANIRLLLDEYKTIRDSERNKTNGGNSSAV